MNSDYSVLTFDDMVQYKTRLQRCKVCAWIGVAFAFLGVIAYGDAKAVLMFLGVTLIFVGAAYSATSPNASLIKKCLADANTIRPQLIELKELLADRSNIIGHLNQELEGLKNGFGSVVIFGDTFTLFELSLQTEFGNAGSLEKAVARIQDNTRTSRITTGASSSTNFNYRRDYSTNEDYLDSADSSTEYEYEYEESGHVTVTIEGPKLVTSHILFDDPRSAMEFANTLNHLGANFKSNKKSSYNAEMAEIKSQLKLAQSSFNLDAATNVVEALAPLDDAVQVAIFGDEISEFKDEFHKFQPSKARSASE